VLSLFPFPYSSDLEKPVKKYFSSFFLGWGNNLENKFLLKKA